MAHKLIKDAFPLITDKDLSKIVDKISDKCSDYYFLDFLKTTNGNTNDAYKLFIFDERLRCLLLKYVLRFEIQIKNTFVECVSKATGDDSFWNKSQYYIFKKQEDFNKLKSKIEESFKNLNTPHNSANSYAATYVMSFGTFVSVFKNINPKYKRNFIKKYTKYLPRQDFDVLHKYLLCMRALRNRCAHGTHLVSNSFVNQLSQFRSLKDPGDIKAGMEHFSVFELTLYFLIHSLNCRKEFEIELKKLLEKNKELYSKYGGKQSINPAIIEKLFKNY